MHITNLVLIRASKWRGHTSTRTPSDKPFLLPLHHRTQSTPWTAHGYQAVRPFYAMDASSVWRAALNKHTTATLHARFVFSKPLVASAPAEQCVWLAFCLQRKPGEGLGMHEMIQIYACRCCGCYANTPWRQTTKRYQWQHCSARWSQSA